MAHFKVNTGCREQEVCGLRWEWEVRSPDSETSVFKIPGHLVKNGEDRFVVLNRVAASVIECQRGIHPEYVFPYRGHRVTRMHTAHGSGQERRQLRSIFKELCKPCPDCFLRIRVHDMRHSFGHRFREAGVTRRSTGLTGAQIRVYYDPLFVSRNEECC